MKNLLDKVNSKPEKILLIIKNDIKNIKSTWVVWMDGVKIELIPDSDSDPASTILESLQMLENVLRKNNMKIGLKLPEFFKRKIVKFDRHCPYSFHLGCNVINGLLLSNGESNGCGKRSDRN